MIKSDVIDNTNHIYGGTLNIQSNYLRNRATIDGDNINISAINGILNEAQLAANKDMTLYTQTNADITNYKTIKANGTLTMSTRNVKNGGYRCGFFYLSTCGKGSIPLTNWSLTLIITTPLKWAAISNINMQK